MRPAHFDAAAWADRQAFLGRRPVRLIGGQAADLLVTALGVLVGCVLIALLTIVEMQR